MTFSNPLNSVFSVATATSHLVTGPASEVTASETRTATSQAVDAFQLGAGAAANKETITALKSPGPGVMLQLGTWRGGTARKAQGLLRQLKAGELPQDDAHIQLAQLAVLDLLVEVFRKDRREVADRMPVALNRLKAQARVEFERRAQSLAGDGGPLKSKSDAKAPRYTLTELREFASLLNMPEAHYVSLGQMVHSQDASGILRLAGAAQLFSDTPPGYSNLRRSGDGIAGTAIGLPINELIAWLQKSGISVSPPQGVPLAARVDYGTAENTGDLSGIGRAMVTALGLKDHALVLKDNYIGIIARAQADLDLGASCDVDSYPDADVSATTHTGPATVSSLLGFGDAPGDLEAFEERSQDLGGAFGIKNPEIKNAKSPEQLAEDAENVLAQFEDGTLKDSVNEVADRMLDKQARAKLQAQYEALNARLESKPDAMSTDVAVQEFAGQVRMLELMDAAHLAGGVGQLMRVGLDMALDTSSRLIASVDLMEAAHKSPERITQQIEFEREFGSQLSIKAGFPGIGVGLLGTAPGEAD